MKLLKRTILFGLLAGAVTCSSQVRLDEFGEPFQPKDLEVIWGSTNAAHTKLKIFRVEPTRFSSQTLSNLIALGNFQNPAAVLTRLQPALKGEERYFTEETTRKHVVISPASGRISFHSPNVIASTREGVEGVPSESEAVAAAIEILSKFGIAESELARKPQSDQFVMLRTRDTRTGRNKARGTLEKKVLAEGVTLYRSIDGIAFNGHGVPGGILAIFGNRKQPASLELSWRTLKFDREIPMPSKEELTKWIKAGRAVIQSEADPARIRKLTITKLTPYYFGENRLRSQKWVAPFAELEAKASTANETIDVTLWCSLVE